MVGSIAAARAAEDAAERQHQERVGVGLVLVLLRSQLARTGGTLASRGQTNTMPLGFMLRLAFALLVASTAACPACAAPRKPALPVVSPALNSAAKPAVEACRIAGPRASLDLTVNAGAEEIAVRVRGARVSVVPGDGETSSVEVKGALELQGRVKGLELFPAAPLVVAGGVVQLGPTSVLQKTSPRGADLVARTVDIGAPFQLSEVSVPCSALSFVGSGDPSERSHRGTDVHMLRRHACPDPCTYYHTPDVLDFHESPGDGAPVRLTGATVVSGLERRGPWTLVSTEDDVHMDGAQLTGWVEHSRLTKIDGGIGFEGGGRGNELRNDGEFGRPSVTGPGVFHGPAHIDAGTPVLALPGGEPWGTVRDAEAEFEVVIRPGNDRAEVWSAPLLPFLGNAWVPITAVHALSAKSGP
jgi:hypothetical protein